MIALSQRFYVLIMVAVLLQGCATSGSVKMIGTEADFIDKAGFADKVSVNWLTSNIYREDKPAVFSPSTKEIIWFMVFDVYAFVGSVEFVAKWQSPDGAVYLENKFTQVPGNWQQAITSLPVSGSVAAEKLGKWHLEVYHKSRLIARRSFRIE